MGRGKQGWNVARDGGGGEEILEGGQQRWQKLAAMLGEANKRDFEGPKVVSLPARPRKQTVITMTMFVREARSALGTEWKGDVWFVFSRGYSPRPPADTESAEVGVKRAQRCDILAFHTAHTASTPRPHSGRNKDE